MSNLYEKTYWTAPIDYITSTYIREYDISKANINILLSLGAITKTEYDYYYRLPKYAREVMVGYLLKDRKDEKLGVDIVKGIREYRRLFFEANDIQDTNVLAIKNDAIFLIDKVAKYTKFGDTVEFKNKDTFTSYYALDRKYNKEFYYLLDIPNNKEILEIKGMGNEGYKLHEPYMIDFFKVLFSTVETAPIDEAVELLQKFSESYLAKELDIGYYRRFDSICGYDTIIHNSIGDMYNMKYLSENDRSIIEIGYNYGIIMNLYKYISSMIFRKK